MELFSIRIRRTFQLVSTIDNIITTQKTMPGVDGYILKHILQEEAGIYLTLPEFEKMMIERGAIRTQIGTFRIACPRIRLKVKRGDYLL